MVLTTIFPIFTMIIMPGEFSRPYCLILRHKFTHPCTKAQTKPTTTPFS